MSKAEDDEKGATRSAEELARAVARKRQKRAARQADGRCAYCGKLPQQAGASRCGRCLELQQERNRALAARRKAVRAEARRAASPRQCLQCGGSELAKDGMRGERQYFRCRTCGRSSFGDGPVVTPEYPCPYCKGRCRKEGTETRANQRRVQKFLCKTCGRTNTNLWPEDGKSPGGPFRHPMTFYLSLQAQKGLEAYFQAKGMSAVQAVREIFIAAGVKPLGFVSRASGRRIGSNWDGGGGNDWNDDWDEVSVHSVAIPAPRLEPLPVGGIALPDLRSESLRKLASQTGRARYCPTVLVTWRLTVHLNDAALQGLLATMTRRGLNHQEAARALCAEARA